MDKSDNYKNYSSDDFAEDSFFWRWVLEENKEDNSFWQDFIKRNPKQLEVIKKARAKVLQINIQEYSLSNDKVSSIWAKIQQSKTKETAPHQTGTSFNPTGNFSLDPSPYHTPSNLPLPK
ncbi:hypothetical protein [Rufibacter tibetensis]|uniref:Uncharacterized protein n=1 Tax=Rufibacter tibetensis TaxID=512763 RepID=A0A0P0CVG6_9BACT|nr:hypothetical protein [Rufibacter tibetensis]ALI98365.1 hypothetical protein DC20_04450 [Rufibacter tibetensis]